jgi:hypothetical protein
MYCQSSNNKHQTTFEKNKLISSHHILFLINIKTYSLIIS